MTDLISIRTNRANSFPVQRFFESVCPKLFELRASLCHALGGRYAFDLEGRGGGRWVIDFCALRARPDTGPADLEIQMSTKQFEALLRGALDLGSAIDRGDVRLRGARTLFENLSVFTHPPSAATLAARQRTFDQGEKR